MKILVKILLIVLWTATASGIVLLMSFSNVKHNLKPVHLITCSVDFQGKQPLFSEKDILAEINQKFGKMTKKSIGDMDVEAISKLIQKNPYLESSNVKLTVDGSIQITAKQNIPIIRYISATGNQVYISETGFIMPVNLSFPYKTIIATGKPENMIPVGKCILSITGVKTTGQNQITKSLIELHYLAKIITHDTVLNALIEQVSLNDQNKFLLATKAGSHEIFLGDTTFAAEKLDNLKYFYKYGLVKTGWKKYNRLNLEYRNQIVCTK